MSGTRLYDRQVRLTISPKGSEEALDLSALRIRFSIIHSTMETPNTGEFRITNLSEKTGTLLRAGGEFTRVRLSAGYPGNFGLIYDGSVIQTRAGRESRTDTYFDLTCVENDKAYQYGTVNAALAAPHKVRDQLNTVHKQAFAPHGVELGYITPAIDDLPTNPRGRAMFGLGRDYMRDIAATTGAHWYMYQGKLNLLQKGTALPDQAIELTSDTGMIGLPQQTQLGIMVRMLLNPGVKPGIRVHINNKSIQRYRYNTAYLQVPFNSPATDPNNQPPLPRVTDDGFYRAITVDHFGDTRGQEFYTEVVCIAIGDYIPQGLLSAASTAPNTVNIGPIAPPGPVTGG